MKGPGRPGRKEKIPEIEARFGAPLRDLLIERYYHRLMTQGQIAEEFDVSVSAVCRWMSRFGLPPAGRAVPPPPDGEQTVTEVAANE